MKKVKPSILSGFPEYLPATQIAFNKMLDSIRADFEKYGFTPIETPTIEKSEVLFAKGGGETEKEIYRFQKGENDLALHYDLTVPLARYVAQHENNLVFPFRRYQIQKNWRAERPQKGRFREFYQCDIDIVGSDSVLHDAEVVAVVNDVFTNLAIGKFTIKINNRKLLFGFVQHLGLSKQATKILRLIDKLDKIGLQNLESELKELGLSKGEVLQLLDFCNITGLPTEIVKALKGLSISNEMFVSGVNELKEVSDALVALKVPSKNYCFDLHIVRGLDYYTGTVYETTLNDYPEFGSICSGGRYDDLAEYYTKTHLAGVGISIGLTRLFSALQDAGLVKELSITTAKVLIVPLDSKYSSNALTVAAKLRSENINTQVYYEGGKVAKAMRFADKLKIGNVVLIGEQEIKNKTYTLKSMNTGEQKTLDLKQVIKILNSKF